MADSRASSREYPFTGRGLCLIINNVHFKWQPTRRGSDKDARDIETVFRGLHFDVYTLKNCTASVIYSQLINLRNGYYSKYQSLFIFFLTHGYENGIYSIDEIRISFNEIQSYLTAAQCPTFKGTPKVLIYGSCRAEQDLDYSTLRLMEEDFLLVFASQGAAYRDTKKGSFYIQCLLRVINEEACTSDFLRILTKANGQLASTKCDQRSIHISMLSKDLFLTRDNRSKMILTRRNYKKSQEEEEDREIVTPTCTLSHDQVTLPTRNTWPKVNRKFRAHQRDHLSPSFSDATTGIEIEKPFEKSTNLTAQKLSPRRQNEYLEHHMRSDLQMPTVLVESSVSFSDPCQNEINESLEGLQWRRETNVRRARTSIRKSLQYHVNQDPLLVVIELEEEDRRELTGAQQVDVLQIMDNDRLIKIVLVTVQLREVENDWLEISYRP